MKVNVHRKNQLAGAAGLCSVFLDGSMMSSLVVGDTVRLELPKVKSFLQTKIWMDRSPVKLLVLDDEHDNTSYYFITGYWFPYAFKQIFSFMLFPFVWLISRKKAKQFIFNTVGLKSVSKEKFDKTVKKEGAVPIFLPKIPAVKRLFVFELLLGIALVIFGIYTFNQPEIDPVIGMWLFFLGLKSAFIFLYYKSSRIRTFKIIQIHYLSAIFGLAFVPLYGAIILSVVPGLTYAFIAAYILIFIKFIQMHNRAAN